MIQRFVLVFVLNVNLMFSKVGDSVCLCDYVYRGRMRDGMRQRA